MQTLPTYSDSQADTRRAVNDLRNTAQANFDELALATSGRALFNEFEDFSCGIQGIKYYTTGRYQSGGRDISEGNPFSIPDPDYACGVIEMVIENTPVGDYTAIWKSSHFFAGTDGGAISNECRLRIQGLATAGDYIVRVGFGVNNLETTPSMGWGWFEYDASQSTNWLAKTSMSSTVTTADTGVAVVAGSYVRLRVATNSAGTETRFFINDVLKASSTTNLPWANYLGRCKLALTMVSNNAAVTARRSFVCDSMHARMVMSSIR